MKKILLFIFICATTIAVAQQHATFLGIEMNGKLTDFNKKLAARDDMEMIPQNTSNTMGLFEWKSNGLTYYVFTNGSRKTNTIWKVDVCLVLSTSYEWSKIKQIFNVKKDGLTKLYGKPVEDVVSFDPPYSERNQPIRALMEEEGEVSTTFIKGDRLKVELSIDADESMLKITESYIDLQNEDLNLVEFF